MGVLSSCSNSPERVPAPGWDPEGISAAALQQLDKNGDAAIDLEEAKGAPGLAAGFHRIDQDRSESLSQDEIRQRFVLYEKLRTGITNKSFEIYLNGRPLAGAKVEFVPEEFQGGVTTTASGVTDHHGVVMPIAEGQDIMGMQIGYFRVQVFDPRKQNAELLELSAPVGVEVSPVSEADESGTPLLKLQTS